MLTIWLCFKKAVGQKEGIFIPVLWMHSWNESSQHQDEIQSKGTYQGRTMRGDGGTMTPPAWLDLSFALRHWLPDHTGVKSELKPATASAVPWASKHVRLHGRIACVWVWNGRYPMKVFHRFAFRGYTASNQHSQTDVLSKLRGFITPQEPPGRFLSLKNNSCKR